MVKSRPLFSTFSIQGINFLKFKTFYSFCSQKKIIYSNSLINNVASIVCILKIIIIYFKINTSIHFWCFSISVTWVIYLSLFLLHCFNHLRHKLTVPTTFNIKLSNLFFNWTYDADKNSIPLFRGWPPPYFTLLLYSAQLLLNYDRIYTAIENKLIQYNLPKPGLFLKGVIDRTSLTFYNRTQVSENV